MRRQRSDSGTEDQQRCLSLEELLEVVRGRAPPIYEDTAAHIDRCSACGTARSWLERLLDATGGPWEEPPASVRERAIQIFAREPLQRGRRRKWSLARLVHDSLSAPLPAGVRGRAIGRRLLYDAGWANVDIEIREARLDPEVFRVTGRLLPGGDAPSGDLMALLWSEGTVVAQAAGDPIGVFVLPEVRSGTYRLEIWAPAQGDAIAVEPFELPMED